MMKQVVLVVLENLTRTQYGLGGDAIQTTQTGDVGVVLLGNGGEAFTAAYLMH